MKEMKHHNGKEGKGGTGREQETEAHHHREKLMMTRDDKKERRRREGLWRKMKNGRTRATSLLLLRLLCLHLERDGGRKGAGGRLGDAQARMSSCQPATRERPHFSKNGIGSAVFFCSPTRRTKNFPSPFGRAPNFSILISWPGPTGSLSTPFCLLLSPLSFYCFGPGSKRALLFLHQYSQRSLLAPPPLTFFAGLMLSSLVGRGGGRVERGGRAVKRGNRRRRGHKTD